MEKDNAIIIFSRLPIGSETKTRLAPLLNEKEREMLHLAMWKDIFSEVIKLKKYVDIFLYWTGNGNVHDYKEHIPEIFNIQEQRGNSSVLENTITQIKQYGFKYELCDTLSDIDTPDDIKNFMFDNRFNKTKTFNYFKSYFLFI